MSTITTPFAELRDEPGDIPAPVGLLNISRTKERS